MKKLVIGADGSGFELKEKVRAYLDVQGISYDDVGNITASDNKAFYNTAADAARGIQRGEYEKGILLCGTGMGVCMAANKFKGIYAACVESVYAAKKCRIINDANIMCMGGNIVGSDMSINMVKEFLNTEFCEGFGEETTEFLKQACVEIKKFEENY